VVVPDGRTVTTAGRFPQRQDAPSKHRRFARGVLGHSARTVVVLEPGGSAIVSAGFTRACSPTVEASPLVGMAEPKLPNPWVGSTAVSAGSSAARRRTDRNCAWVSSTVSCGSIDPPVNTPSTAPEASART
jgi:hypothetical protein